MIEYSNALATRFLNLFGIEQGNGLSPLFLTSIATPSDLKDQILQFFKPPKLDNRGRGASVMSGSTTKLDDNHIDEVNNDGEDEDNHPTMDPMNALSPEMIASHVSFINDCNSESATDNMDNNENDGIQNDGKHECALRPNESDGGATRGRISSNSFEQFMELMNCNNLDAVGGLALNFIQLLELGKLSSGSIYSQSKYMSRNQRWFKAKEGGGMVMQQ